MPGGPAHGGGKSLCFQLPALVRQGLVLVISPWWRLMQDQVSQLRRRRDSRRPCLHAGLDTASAPPACTASRGQCLRACSTVRSGTAARRGHPPAVLGGKSCPQAADARGLNPRPEPPAARAPRKPPPAAGVPRRAAAPEQVEQPQAIGPAIWRCRRWPRPCRGRRAGRPPGIPAPPQLLTCLHQAPTRARSPAQAPADTRAGNWETEDLPRRWAAPQASQRPPAGLLTTGRWPRRRVTRANWLSRTGLEGLSNWSRVESVPSHPRSGCVGTVATPDLLSSREGQPQPVWGRQLAGGGHHRLRGHSTGGGAGGQRQRQRQQPR